MSQKTHIEEMTDEVINISYSFSPSIWGDTLIASTSKGICYLGFPKKNDLTDLKRRFPKATFTQKEDESHQQALLSFVKSHKKTLNLHLKGTPFQLAVWRTLLKIPKGSLSTYKNTAEMIAKPKASRAVGTAIGKNPISLFIPCHRVIQTSGALGGYMWGLPRKKAILDWEQQESL